MLLYWCAFHALVYHHQPLTSLVPVGNCADRQSLILFTESATNMQTYLDQIGRKYNSESNHAFLLYGATRDLQLGVNGSCQLPDHLMQSQAEARIVAIFCIGRGWQFSSDADRASFRQITGIDQAS